MKSQEQFILEALQRGQINLQGLNQESADKIINVLGSLAVKQARADFYTYVKLMADDILPSGFTDGRHIRLICKKLQEVEQSIVDVYEGRAKQTKRKQFFLPPGAMKSVLISVLFSSWFLGRHPKWRVLQLGYSADFAKDNFGRPVKDIMSSEKFRKIFPECELRQDTRAADRFNLTKGGGYFCTGAGAQIAGRRAHLLICDDVITEQTAWSDTERTKIVRWYIPGARSRLLPNSTEIIVNTRWHIDDLSAYLEKVDNTGKNPWEIISIPAILDEAGANLLGLQKGHSYWPEFYPDNYFFNIRDSYMASGEAARWSALYMQNPVPEEGNIVKKEMIQWWDEVSPPKCDFIIVSVDTAFETTKRADFSAITVWGVFKTTKKGHNGHKFVQNNIILLDAHQGKWELNELIETLEEVQKEYEPNWFLIEKKASGISVLQELRRNPKFNIYEIMPDRDKMTRLQAALPTFKAKCVWFPRGMEYVGPVVTQLLQFPAGKKDYVDTTSQLINWMRLNLVIVQENEMEEDEDEYESRKPQTYWGSLQRHY